LLPILRRNHFLQWILLKLAGNALQGQNEIPVFYLFFKGTDKIFFFKRSFATAWRECDTNRAVVSDRFGAIECKEVTKNGRFRPLGSVR
jgi:hypothetical protein